MTKLPAVALALAIALGTVAVACGGGDAPSTTEPTLAAQLVPTARPSPTPRPTAATRDRGFVSFTDEMKLFTVSHPPGWQLARAVMVGVDQITSRNTESGASDAQRPPIGVVFFAGVPTPQGYAPNVSIVVESLPSGLAVDEYFEATQEFAIGLFTGYKVRSRTGVLVAGREAIMAELEYDFPSSASGSGKWSSIQTVMVDGTRGWAISCGVAAPASAEDLQTCNTVVRSFRLLQ